MNTPPANPMKSTWNDETQIVLDACALIAFLNDELGAEIVAAMLEDSISVEMSAINLLEIAYDAVRSSGGSEAITEILDAVNQLPIKIHWHMNEEVFRHAAEYKSSYRISLADAIALALAKSLNAPVATSDHHEFDLLDSKGLARFIWIR
jgi:PIN domain nuclease of toxin-antitoxin system